MVKIDLDINQLLYKELVDFLKQKDERISNDLFRAILSACRMVMDGTSVRSATRLAGIGATFTHFEGKELSLYVNVVTKNVREKVDKRL